MASLVQNNNEHSLTSPEQNAPVNLARLRVTKVRRFQEPRTADFGKSTSDATLHIPVIYRYDVFRIVVITKYRHRS